jgi:hypothetical protein
MAIVRGRIFYSNEMTGAVLVIHTSTDITAPYEDAKKNWYKGVKEILHRKKYNIDCH